MPPTHDMQGKVLASAILLALLMQPVAQAQDSVLPLSSTTQSQRADAPSSNHSSAPASNSALSLADSFPDSPGSLQAQQEAPADQRTSDPDSNRTPASTSPSQPSSAAQQSQGQNNPPQEPRGTAAAESIETTGVAASRPAGAAVAPAKQRRVRSILIKVGALVGVGAAVGATMALSQGSPSRPPGSR
jgi:hypothetical protein